MAGHADEYELALSTALTAFDQMKALCQPPTPRNFEIWYKYSTGHYPALNHRINEILKTGGKITDDDVEQFYNSLLAPLRLTERINSVGSRFMDEIEQVMAMIDAAAGTASSYSESLADASKQLDQSLDRDGVRAIVEGLVQTAKEMEESNHKLEARLSASKQEITELQTNLDAVRAESLTDPLTQLSNRKYFDTTMRSAAEEAAACDGPLTLLMIDVDHFKKFNDSYGHLTGDQVLRLVANSLKQNIKGQDTAARYGGEEFAVILPNTVQRDGATVAEHIRRAVMTKELMKRSTGERLGRITVSVGVATLHPGDTAQSLIERADACLYAAKRHGRNRVICESDPEASAPAANVA